MATKDLAVKRLREKYKSDNSFKSICDDFAGRERASWTSTVARTSQRTLLSRGEVVRIFRELEEIDGIGKFIVGRRTQPSRFEWDRSSLSVGQAAAGEVTELEEKPSDSKDVETDEASLVPHPFRLRGDLVIEINLPTDFSQNEAARLSDFVKTLPFR